MTTTSILPSRPIASLLRASLGLAILTLLLFGLAYALSATALGRLFFPHAASGSLIEREGILAGSLLVAQPFAAEHYFQLRPSASNYDPMAMSGSNQARSNPALHKRLEETRQALAAREGVLPEEVPGELVTQSGSGGDPHLSPAAAHIQIARVARARGLDAARVSALVERHTEGAQFGVLGQPRVNALALNLALDQLSANDSAKAAHE